MKVKRLIGEIISLTVTITVIFIIVFTLNITLFTISEVKQVSIRNTLLEGDIVYYIIGLPINRSILIGEISCFSWQKAGKYMGYSML
ncbi:MAG: hypothetical protein GX022_03140 [Clostridiaceae bacterium]|nr:hypothetical protein [Clostridiaceae bacterium]